jgi:hypothetical protein
MLYFAVFQVLPLEGVLVIATKPSIWLDPPRD